MAALGTAVLVMVDLVAATRFWEYVATDVGVLEKKVSQRKTALRKCQG